MGSVLVKECCRGSNWNESENAKWDWMAYDPRGNRIQCLFKRRDGSVLICEYLFVCAIDL